MPDGYGSHIKYMERVRAQVEARAREIESGLRAAFARLIRREEIEVIAFSKVSTETLADAILRFPTVLKPLLAACNVAARAIERDLQIKNLDTYKPRLTRDQAVLIAQLLKPCLPSVVAIPALSLLDQTAFIDKEVRKWKGQWEKEVLLALSRLASVSFKKRTFTWRGDEYEIDAAAPATGRIKYGIDVKRIEARRDIHKRCDEIVNKADKFKRTFPEGKFGAVVYYPFEQEHSDIRDRLRSENITDVQFASEAEESIDAAVNTVLGTFGIRRK